METMTVDQELETLQRELGNVEAVLDASDNQSIWTDEYDEDAFEQTLARHEDLTERILRLRMKDKVTDLGMIEEAFALLKQQGYEAVSFFACCSDCAYRELREYGKCVFWNAQVDEFVFDGGYTLLKTLHLQWRGDPYSIVATLQVVGFGERVEHDGSPENAIAIHPKGSTVSSGSRFQAAG
jgi:hypothetical protein